MKSLNKYINEDAANESKIGAKIDNVFAKNQNKLSKIVQARQAHWDSNMNDWSREPMFLIAAPVGQLENNPSHRDYSWIRWKYMKGHAEEVQGTFRNYNVEDGEGNKPNSVIGIYYDRHFQIITSLEVFKKIYDILDKDYEKYYNNLYENQKDED